MQCHVTGDAYNREHQFPGDGRAGLVDFHNVTLAFSELDASPVVLVRDVDGDARHRSFGDLLTASRFRSQLNMKRRFVRHPIPSTCAANPCRATNTASGR